MGEPVYSETTDYGFTFYYDEYGNQVGHSENAYGCQAFYDENNNRIGHSEPCAGGQVYYDEDYNSTGYSYKTTGGTGYIGKDGSGGFSSGGNIYGASPVYKHNGTIEKNTPSNIPASNDKSGKIAIGICSGVLVIMAIVCFVSGMLLLGIFCLFMALSLLCIGTL